MFSFLYLKKVVTKGLGNKEIAHQETGVIPDKVCFTKTLGFVLKIECKNLCFNKLYLNQDNIRQECVVYSAPDWP